MATQQAATGQVLEFQLGEETYCVSIDCVTEIVDVGDLTTVPNAPPHVEGVMDLRGRTTSIVDPKTVFGIQGAATDGGRIIVFDPNIAENQSAVGWLVDEVYQVVQVDPQQIDQSPGNDNGSIRGVIERDADFVIWVDPAVVHASR